VVLMDVTMAGLNGLEATMRAARDHRGVRVVILSMHNNEEYVVHAVQAGASGYLLKDVATTELETAIRTVMKGQRYLSAEAAQRVADYEERFGTITTKGGSPGSPGSPPARDPTQLTQREREVLQLIAEGRTMQEIATVLAISPKTVETHRYRLMDRLNIHHVAGLVRYALRTGLVQPE
jgi:DNA-binding NarL/FixJ family response regulator